MDEKKGESSERHAMIPGAAILGCFVVGIGGLLMAIGSLAHGVTTAAACLIAPAIVFGLLANALLRE